MIMPASAPDSLLHFYVGAPPIINTQDDVISGWVIGAASAALAVRWVTFSEAFWRGAGGGDDGFGAVGHDTAIPSLRDNGALQLMMGSQHGSGMGDGDEDAGNDMSVLKAGAGIRGEAMV